MRALCRKPMQVVIPRMSSGPLNSMMPMALALPLVLVFLSLGFGGDVIQVPTGQPTIQDGIDVPRFRAFETMQAAVAQGPSLLLQAGATPHTPRRI